MSLSIGTSGWSYPDGGCNDARWWHHDQAEDRSNYFSTAAEQRELTRAVREVAAQTADTCVFYNNHYRAKAVVNALQLELETGRPVRTPLPDTLIRESPELEVVQATARAELPPGDDRAAASA